MAVRHIILEARLLPLLGDVCIAVHLKLRCLGQMLKMGSAKRVNGAPLLLSVYAASQACTSAPG